MGIFYTILALAFVFPFSPSSNSGISHGTVICAIICHDGIVIASDSRASFSQYDPNSNKEVIYAYVDSTRKIFDLGIYKIAISGTSNVGNQYWEDILKKYNILHRSDSTLYIEFERFKDYLRTKLKIKDSIINENGFILGGYENKIPVIMGTDLSGNIHKTSKINARVFSDSCIQSQLLSIGDLNCTNIEYLLEKGIFSCTTNNIGIGGPIDIVKIKPDNSSILLKTFHSTHYHNYVDFQRKILKKEIKVFYVYPWSEEWLKGVLNYWLHKASTDKLHS